MDFFILNSPVDFQLKTIADVNKEERKKEDMCSSQRKLRQNRQPKYVSGIKSCVETLPLAEMRP
jgi:hypothetical protein